MSKIETLIIFILVKVCKILSRKSDIAFLESDIYTIEEKIKELGDKDE